KAAGLVAAGSAVTSALSPQVVLLAEGVMKAMWLTKLKVITAVLLVIATVGAGASGAVLRMTATDKAKPSAAEEPRAQAPAAKQSAREPARPAAPRAQLTRESLERWGKAEAVFAAQLTKVDQGPVGLSEPPLYNHTLHFQIDKVLRGPM